MKNKRRVVVIVVIVSAVILGGALFFARQHKQKRVATETEYSVVKLQKQEPLTLMGKIEAQKTRVLQNPAGKINEVAVKNGQNVTQGQTLLTTYDQAAQQEATEQQTTIAKLQRSLSSTNDQVKNLQQQLAKLSSSADDYSDVKKQLTDAQNDAADVQADLTSAQTKKQQLDKKINGTLTAPYSGTVTVNYSTTGTPTIQLQGDAFQATGEVSEYSYQKLALNTKLSIKAVATKTKTTTQVAYLSTTSARDSQKNDAKYEFSAPVSGNFIEGQTIKISVAQPGIKVPTSAIYRGKIFLVKQQHVSGKLLVKGTQKSGFVIVKNGLQAGQKIVRNPDSHLKNGSRVVQ